MRLFVLQLLLVLAVSPALAQCSDCDGDGFQWPVDCNDSDLAVHPGAPESCDGRDNDCNGLVDDNLDCLGTCDSPGKLGGDVQVSIGPKSGVNSSLVWTGAEYGVAYDVLDIFGDGPGEIRHRRLDPAGSPLAPEVLVTEGIGDQPCRPSMVWTGSEYGLAWIDVCNQGAGTFFARLDASGGKIDGDVQVGAPFSAYVLSTAWNGREYGVVWTDYRNPNPGIFFARMDRHGVKQGAEVRVSDNGAQPRIPSLVWTGTEYAVAWDDTRDGKHVIYLAHFPSSGTKLGTDIPVSTSGYSIDPSLVWTGTGYGVAWWDIRDGNAEIYFARLDANGNKIGPDVRVTNDPADSFSPSLVWTGKEFGVSWDDQRVNREIFFARLDVSGQKIGKDLRVTQQAAESLLSHIVWTGNEYGVSWFDLRESFPPAYSNIYFTRIGCHLENQPPVADAGRDIVAECTSPQGALISLDGSESYDPVGDIASFEWYSDFNSPSQMHIGTGARLDVLLSLGIHEITLVVTNDAGAQAVDSLLVTVSDTIPPTLSPLQLTQTVLWPPNHRMVGVQVSAQAVDTCTGMTIRLESLTSSEPDDGPDTGDGNTINDIQGGEIGASDFDFLLRAERAEPGSGRAYTIVYSATDSARNRAFDSTTVVVPDRRDGKSDPLFVSVSQENADTRVNWSAAPGALFYNVVRGAVGNLTETKDSIRLGPLVCLVSGAPPEGISQIEDETAPEAGAAFFYLVEYNDGLPSSYGSPSASKPSFGSGGCP